MQTKQTAEIRIRAAAAAAFQQPTIKISRMKGDKLAGVCLAVVEWWSERMKWMRKYAAG